MFTKQKRRFWFARQPSHVPGATLVDPLLKEVSACFEWLEKSVTDESKPLLTGSSHYRGFETIHYQRELITILVIPAPASPEESLHDAPT